MGLFPDKTLIKSIAWTDTPKCLIHIGKILLFHQCYELIDSDDTNRGTDKKTERGGDAHPLVAYMNLKQMCSLLKRKNYKTH